MDFNGHKPIYLQIYDHVCERILSGEFRSGDRVMSVRELGIELGVNPNTVMRAFERLQMKEFLENEVPEFLKKMELYGIKMEEIVSLQQISK